MKGERCYGQHDWGSKGRTNAIGALLHGKILTVCLLAVTVNTLVFDPWVVDDLIPKLPERSVVIMDNAAFHKSETMRQALASKGHTLLYRPLYSPNLHSIEKKWAQTKTYT